MNTAYIFSALLLILTIFAGLDMYRHFRAARRLRETEAALARSARQVIIAMGPFPELLDDSPVEVDLLVLRPLK